MSDCPPRESLLLSLLKPLTADARAAMTAHIAGCDRCRRRFDALRSLGYSSTGGEPRSGRTTSCPEPARIEALVDPERASPDDGAIAAHILTCEHCQDALHATMHRARLSRQGGDGGKEPPARRRRRSGWLALLLLACGALMLIVLRAL